MTIKSLEQLKSQRLDESLTELKAERKGKNLIDKKSITFHAKDAADESASDGIGGAYNSAPMRPTEDQLNKINQYTRSPKTADELVVFSTLSANTLPDRDDDYFDKGTIDGFAELPEPYGPNGKAYMVGHDYSKLPSGRIFDTATQNIKGATFLTNEVYVPNTEQYKNFIENIDFGVNWAVSVGVMLEAQLCSICQAPQYSSFFFGGVCETGHIKSAMYDPKETRTDDWGLILEALPDDPKAVKALGNMHGAKDFYELSQVFLGAQFHAQLDKGASNGVLKSAINKAVAQHIPVLGLRRAEAENLGLEHAPEKLVNALQHFAVDREKNGDASWTDDEGLRWFYSPGDEIVCLGRSAPDANNDNDKEVDSDGEGQTGQAAVGAASGADEVGSGASVGQPSGDGHGDDSDEQDDSSDNGSQAERSVGSVTDAADGGNTEKEDEMSKQAVLDAAKRVKVPAAFLSAINDDAAGNGLEAVLRVAAAAVTEKDAEIATLTPKAAMGDQYLKQLRADAVDWYVKAHALAGERAVRTETFEKILDACGENTELIKALCDEQRSAALAKAPATRQSSFEADPHKQESSEQAEDTQLTSGGRKAISRIHG